MKRCHRLCRAVALTLALAMALTSLPLGLAHAGLVPTDRLVAPSAAAPADRERVVAFLQRDDVRRQMAALGVDADEAAARVAGLSDAEIATITGRLDRLSAGQGAVGSVIGAALVIFLVLLLTDILGLTDVFPFVRR